MSVRRGAHQRAGAGAHDLSLSSWQGAEISKLVDEELAPYSSAARSNWRSRSAAAPATAQTLALALHELVTNSAKYGALSTRSGRLAIGWQVEDDLLTLTWEETGGPLVRTPKSRGFGTRSVIASVESQLGGQARIRLARRGPVVPCLRCR